MPNTTGYSFGDVVLVPFPFTDQTASKKRPAVVVSADAYHQRRPDVIVMAVTSQILRPTGALGEVLIGDWQGAGLPKASLIKPVLATIDPSGSISTLPYSVPWPLTSMVVATPTPMMKALPAGTVPAAVIIIGTACSNIAAAFTTAL